MNARKTFETDMNGTSNKWFKPTIDKAVLRELSQRNNAPGWKHVILFTLSLLGLGFLCLQVWSTWWFIPVYLAYLSLIHI